MCARVSHTRVRILPLPHIRLVTLLWHLTHLKLTCYLIKRCFIEFLCVPALSALSIEPSREFPVPWQACRWNTSGYWRTSPEGFGLLVWGWPRYLNAEQLAIAWTILVTAHSFYRLTMQGLGFKWDRRTCRDSWNQLSVIGSLSVQLPLGQRVGQLWTLLGQSLGPLLWLIWDQSIFHLCAPSQFWIPSLTSKPSFSL